MARLYKYQTRRTTADTAHTTALDCFVVVLQALLVAVPAVVDLILLTVRFLAAQAVGVIHPD